MYSASYSATSRRFPRGWMSHNSLSNTIDRSSPPQRSTQMAHMDTKKHDRHGIRSILTDTLHIDLTDMGYPKVPRSISTDTLHINRYARSILTDTLMGAEVPCSILTDTLKVELPLVHTPHQAVVCQISQGYRPHLHSIGSHNCNKTAPGTNE